MSLRTVPLENVEFRGPSSSEQYNEFQKAVFLDLTNLFELSGKTKMEILDIIDTLYNENLALQLLIKRLESQIDLLQSNTVLPNEIVHGAFFYTNENLPDTIQPITGPSVNNDLTHWQRNYGELTLPINNHQSKVNITDPISGQIFVPKELEASFELTPTGDLITIDKGDIFRAFNGIPGQYWKYQAYSPSGSVESVEGTITIKLPLNISSNTFVNTLTIDPFPEFTMDILSIDYVTPNHEVFSLQELLTNSTLQVASYLNHLNPQVAFFNIGKTVYRFKREEIIELRIKVKQSTFSKKPNQAGNYFTLGAQNLGVEYLTYAPTSTVYVVFDAEATSVQNLGYTVLARQFGKIFLSNQTPTGDPLPDNITRLILEQGVNNPAVTPVITKVEYKEAI